MGKACLVVFCALIVFSLAGCTMDVSQPAAATSLPDVSTAASTPAAASPMAANTIPVTWAGLDLSGRLVYSTVSTEGGVYTSRIQWLDLVTGEVGTIFTVSGNGWIYYLTVSPDASQLIMSYTPPSQPGVDSATSLYVLPLEKEATPEILFTPPTPDDRYIQVEWSPDGGYIYFVHYNHAAQPADQPYPAYQISRMAYPNGQPEIILDRAFWPRLSPDSSKIVYVTMDPFAGTNQLFVADSDGSNPQLIELAGFAEAEILDAPIFAPDGQSILFSAPSPVQSYQPNWLDRLTGVQIAKAHNIPSDWWSVPVSGGTVTRLTQTQTIKLFASISPDGKHIASLSGEGIFVMDLAGSNLTRILSDPGISSVVNWIP